MQNKTSVWAAGAAIVAIGIFAAAYFLLIGPVMDSTAETNEQRTQVEAQNQTLRSQNATLRGQFQNIDELRGQLAELQTQVPDAAEWDTFTTMVGNLANDNGAIVTSITGQPAVSIAGVGSTPAPAEETTPDGAAADGVAPEAAPTAVATGQAIPVTISFQGSSDAVLGTVDGLQAVDQRLFLVQKVVIQGMKPNTSAQPPVAPGDSSVVLNGYILVQPPVAAVPDQVPPTPWGGSTSPFSPAT